MSKYRGKFVELLMREVDGKWLKYKIKINKRKAAPSEVGKNEINREPWRFPCLGLGLTRIKMSKIITCM